MQVLTLKLHLSAYLKKRGLEYRFAKQLSLFKSNPLHPSLHTEILEPKHLRVYSFRIARNYRAIFIYCGNDIIEIIDINNHYQ